MAIGISDGENSKIYQRNISVAASASAKEEGIENENNEKIMKKRNQRKNENNGGAAHRRAPRRHGGNDCACVFLRTAAPRARHSGRGRNGVSWHQRNENQWRSNRKSKIIEK
jgi:hypothetical protein